MAYWKENINYRQENGKYLIAIDGRDVEVEQALYQAYTKMERRERYLIEREKGICISLDALPNGGEQLIQPEESAEETVTRTERQRAHAKLLRRLRTAVAELTDEERALLKLIYLDGKTERDASHIFGISQPAIHKRKQRILEKLKNLLEN